MCEKCTELDRKITYYKGLQSRVTDQITLDGIARLIAELLAKKSELHLGPKE